MNTELETSLYNEICDNIRSACLEIKAVAGVDTNADTFIADHKQDIMDTVYTADGDLDDLKRPHPGDWIREFMDEHGLFTKIPGFDQL